MPWSHDSVVRPDRFKPAERSQPKQAPFTDGNSPKILKHGVVALKKFDRDSLTKSFFLIEFSMYTKPCGKIKLHAWQISFHLAKTETSWFQMENYQILALFTFLFIKATLLIWIIHTLTSLSKYLVCTKYFRWFSVVLTESLGGRCNCPHFTNKELRLKGNSSRFDENSSSFS